jgi:hypothetical protein
MSALTHLLPLMRIIAHHKLTTTSALEVAHCLHPAY